MAYRANSGLSSFVCLLQMMLSDERHQAHHLHTEEHSHGERRLLNTARTAAEPAPMRFHPVFMLSGTSSSFADTLQV